MIQRACFGRLRILCPQAVYSLKGDTLLFFFRFLPELREICIKIFMNFIFGGYKSNVIVSKGIPSIDSITNKFDNALIIADENTAGIASKICGGNYIPHCVIKSGEENKTWRSVETILSSAVTNKLGRDCIFIAAGGGVICDISAFAASVYMRGCNLALVPTTLLAMVDASVGGKTGFDFCGIKNLAGTFYPAENIYIPVDCLSSLPQREWKSGFAEIIKTAILANDFFDQLDGISSFDYKSDALLSCIEKAVAYKGKIVTEDPRESGGRRILLNLGHTFAHALESVLGLGNISHGEAVAWGIIRACRLGVKLGITGESRAKKITGLIKKFGYESEYNCDKAALIGFMKNDKKKRDGKLAFIVPDEKSAAAVTLEKENDLKILEEILV